MIMAPHIGDPDGELVGAVTKGDEKAFEKLVEKYKNAVFNTIYRYIGYYDDVEDVAQEVFLKVWHKASSFKGRSKFSTWLYRIVVNECLGYRRKHKHASVSLEGLTDAGITPKSLITEMDVNERAQTKMVRTLLRELPERQRLALILSHYDGYSYKEIAAIMKTSLSSVESLIHRAKESLKKKLVLEKEKRYTEHKYREVICI
jgi:RNA polymerase sigma factor (sigma-70 family)